MKSREERSAEREENALRKNLITYGVLLLIGLALAMIVAQLQGFPNRGTLAANAAALSDGFFVSGVLLTGIGALVWVSTTGFFDIISYGVRNLAALTVFRYRKDYKRFYEFKEEQRAKRKPRRLAVLIVGLIMLAAAAVCLMIYSKAK